MGNEQSVQAGNVSAGGSAPSNNSNGRPAVSTMNNEVSRKFAHGAAYNMRVIIRGDRNTGKTQLWNRMQGKSFSNAYIPTAQIQTATIDWNHKTTSEVIKVEVWDVVDKALKSDGDDDNNDDDDDDVNDTTNDITTIDDATLESAIKAKSMAPKQQQQKQKQQNQQGSFTMGLLDATMVDVMRGTSGVIFMFDMTKRWTWEYIRKDLEAAAKSGASVLVVGNFRDMGDNRVVTEAEVRECLAGISKDIWYTEASMKNMLGLKMISRFLSLPFLRMQRQALLGRLQKNATEDAAAHNDFKTLSEDSSYDDYARAIQDRKDPSSAAKRPAQPTTTAAAAAATSNDGGNTAAASKAQSEVKAPAKGNKAVAAAPKKPAEAQKKAQKKPAVDPAEEEKKNKQQEEDDAISQLKALSTKKTTGKSIDDFKPDDGDDIFGGTVDDDGWITKEPDDDEWGSALGGGGGDDEDDEEEKVAVAPTKKAPTQKKKKKQTVILDDEDF